MEVLLTKVQEHISKSGDGPWLINGARRATGSSNVFGAESYNFAEVECIAFWKTIDDAMIMLSSIHIADIFFAPCQVEPRARQMARILHRRFSIGRGDVIHFVMPGNTEVYFPVIGTWLLQARHSTEALSSCRVGVNICSKNFHSQCFLLLNDMMTLDQRV